MFNYDHDCPFEAYVTNLGKYNDGELVGEWVKFPTTYEKMQEVFQRIGIDGVRYEEWFITDYDCYVDGLYCVLGEYESLDELNYLAEKIDSLVAPELEKMEAVIQNGDSISNVADIINLLEGDNMDCYDFIPEISDDSDLGYYWIEESGAYDLKSLGSLASYIDYEKFGRDVRLDEGGFFVEPRGYMRSTGDSFIEHYDGSRENIPEEYRVMSAPELSEDERLEMAQELAFDLDEFFRQKDPQYAAAHSDAHAGKELIADLLLEGKTAAIKDRLAEMAQMPDDELPARMGEFERATGYEAYLDNDVPAIREKLEQAQEREAEPIRPDDFKTGERIETPRGSFSVADMTREQIEAAGYGFHHASDDGLYHIMGNGERAFAIMNEDARTYDLYQLKDSPDRRDYAFEALDRLHEQGRRVDMQNYDKVYSGVMRPNENLESIYTRFNIERPEDFTGHSLSMSDVVVIRQNGQDTAYYCDRIGFEKVPEFFEPENYLKNTEMAMEDDFGMIDGIVNNGTKETATPGRDEKSSIRERLDDAKRECSERKPPDVKKPEKNKTGQDL